MKLINDPVDYLNDGISSVQLLNVSGNDKVHVNAARVSFNADDVDSDFNEKDNRLLRYLLKHDHSSVLEHSSFTFRVTAPLHINVQVLRHRIGTSFNQVSRRYTEIDEDKFYIPSQFRLQSKNNRQASVPPTDDLLKEAGWNLGIEAWESSLAADYQKAWRQCYNIYQRLLAKGNTREQARGVLPVGQYTEFWLTLNMRSFLHFYKLRSAGGAQWEIQLLANAMMDLIEPYFPATIAAYKQLQEE